VLEIEAAGFEVLGGLPDAFLAIFDAGSGPPQPQLLPLPSSSAPGWAGGGYRTARICSSPTSVAGMTDQNAESYKTIKGIELPKGRSTMNGVAEWATPPVQQARSRTTGARG
jgi:dGTPase